VGQGRVLQYRFGLVEVGSALLPDEPQGRQRVSDDVFVELGPFVAQSKSQPSHDPGAECMHERLVALHEGCELLGLPHSIL